MREVNVRDTRLQLAQLLDAVATGEDVVILRRGRPTARLVALDRAMTPFPDRSALRDALPPMRTSAVDTVRRLRDEHG